MSHYVNGGPPHRGVDRLLERVRAHGRPLPTWARHGTRLRINVGALMKDYPGRTVRGAARGPKLAHEDLSNFTKIIKGKPVVWSAERRQEEQARVRAFVESRGGSIGPRKTEKVADTILAMGYLGLAPGGAGLAEHLSIPRRTADDRLAALVDLGILAVVQEYSRALAKRQYAWSSAWMESRKTGVTPVTK